MKYWGIIRAKWKIDGTTTLEEAAESLEAFANSLREMDYDEDEFDEEEAAF